MGNKKQLNFRLSDLERRLQNAPPGTWLQDSALIGTLRCLPSNLTDEYPKTTAVRAASGELVPLPVHQRRFSYIYAEGIAPDYDQLKAIIESHGVYLPAQPVTRNPAAQPGEEKGNVAFYVIDYYDSDAGPYQELFIVIKLRSKTHKNSFLQDLFCWHVAVNQPRAWDWGSVWSYPKVLYPGHATIELRANHEWPFACLVEPHEQFPGLRWEWKSPPASESFWSTRELGGGFSFINGAADGSRVVRAPVENQGLYRIGFWGRDDARQLPPIEWVIPRDSPFALLAHTDWRLAFIAKDFAAVGFEGREL